MFENLDVSPEATIKVVGVGGAGGNAINEMMRQELRNVTFIALNTDAQALKKSEADIAVQIGQATTNGYGCGAEPSQGSESALESEELIRSHLEGTDMLFIACGMGGGTGTGASPVVAKIAKELNILTVAVVTKPFTFEGKKRMIAAEAGIEHLKNSVDSIIIIENDNLKDKLPKGTTLLNSFNEANKVLCSAVYAIAEVITASGMINVDFADVKTVMKSTGRALMGAGEGSGENKAEQASERAIESPLLEDFEMKAAKGILCTITHGLDFTIDEMSIIGDKVQSLASPDATVVIGTIPNPDMEDRCVVTVIATGIDGEVKEEYPAFDIAKKMRTESKSTPRAQAKEPIAQTPSMSRPIIDDARVEEQVHSMRDSQEDKQQVSSATQERQSAEMAPRVKTADHGVDSFERNAVPNNDANSKSSTFWQIPGFLKQ